MDKVIMKGCGRDSLYDILEVMADHSLTINQAIYILCEYHGIEYEKVEASDITSLYNKGLLVAGGKVNQTLLFHLKKPKQTSLDLKTELKPVGIEYTLAIADKIEKEFVIDKYLSDDERKRIADKYFKGDTTIARYFIIFKSLFPVRSKDYNSKWNKKFGFIYEGISLWDDSLRVAKKFLEIYKKLDIGIFLEATYRKIKDSIDFETERCYMTKPYKFLTSYDTYFQQTAEQVKERLERKLNNDNKNSKTKDKLKKLNV